MKCTAFAIVLTSALIELVTPFDGQFNEYNDNKFDTIERWDETKIAQDGLSFEIDITKFSPCIAGKQFGAWCGSECKWNGGFCSTSLGLLTYTCDGINTQDRKLCTNPLIWRNVNCTFFWSTGEVRYYKQRCTGRNMECYTPWYADKDGRKEESCSDKSDQIFNKSLTVELIKSLKGGKKIHKHH